MQCKTFILTLSSSPPPSALLARGLPTASWAEKKRENIWLSGALDRWTDDQIAAFADAITLVESEG